LFEGENYKSEILRSRNEISKGFIIIIIIIIVVVAAAVVFD
jgi:flagellar basal body-associated protein FliL